MKNHWYCHVEGQDYGPFTWEQLRAMAAEGRIVTDSFVRRDVDQQWFQAAQVPGLLPKSHAGSKKNGAASSAVGKSASVRNSDSGMMAAVSGDPSKSATAIKRPKKAASQSSGNIPVGSVPVGQAVAAPPVTAKAAPVGVAAGQPAAPAFAFSVATAPPPTKAGEPPAPAKKETSPLLIVGILGGAVALVAVIGIGILVWSLTRPAKTPEERVADAMQQEMRGALEEIAKDLQENPPAELNPQAQASDLQPIAEEMQKALKENLAKQPAGSTPGAGAAATPASAAEAAKVLKAVARWTDASQLRGVELNKLKLSLGSVWLAADEAGTRIEPAAGAPGAKYVFVQVQVKNIAPVARKYKSWNVTAGTSAVMADQSNAVLSLVPSSATPAAGRLATVDLQPGQSITDTLVFTAPGGSIEKLKLALAKSALAENAKFKTGSHFALEIPLEVLLAGGSSAGAANSADEPIAANRPGSPMPGEDPVGVIAPQPPAPSPMPEAAPPAAAQPAGGITAPPKKEDRPPTKEELNKQFEELGKQEGQPEAKKGEAQK